MQPMAKRGPAPNHHWTSDGNIIIGLRRDKKSRRFYPVGKGSPNFGTDEAIAIHRVRFRQAKQGKDQDLFEARSLCNDLVVDELDAESLAALNPDLLLDSPIVRGVFREYYCGLIYSNPRRAATELECEPVALLVNVEDLQPPQPSRPLTEVCSAHLDDKVLTPTNGSTWLDRGIIPLPHPSPPDGSECRRDSECRRGSEHAPTPRLGWTVAPLRCVHLPWHDSPDNIAGRMETGPIHVRRIPIQREWLSSAPLTDIQRGL